MTTSFASKMPMSDNNSCQIAISKFQKYTNNNFEGKFFWESIKIDFKN